MKKLEQIVSTFFAIGSSYEECVCKYFEGNINSLERVQRRADAIINRLENGPLTKVKGRCI